MSEVKLNEMQQKAFGAMCAGKDVFLSGGAGTGKSYLLKLFMESHGNRTLDVAT